MPRPRRDPADVPVHWLKGNAREWTPADVVFFDSETTATATPEGESLRCCFWAARAVQRRNRKADVLTDRSATGTTPGQFADWLAAEAGSHRTTWAFAHNLAFDTTVLSIPIQMRRRGWRLTDFSTSDGAPFFRLSRADHSLVLTDSWSWLPVALQGLAKAVGKVKPPLPDSEAPREAYRDRCEADVDILAASILDLMAWWDRSNLGNWTLTGAGCGWNAYRHKAGGGRVLIDPNPEGRRLERTALYGGRREAFRVGTLPAGRYLEMDLRNAYPSAAMHHPLPVKRVRAFDRLDFDSHWLRSPIHSVIARTLVNVDQPGVPFRWNRQVFYPVGRFWTTLAGPELMPLLAAGRVEAIGPGFAYRLGTVMQPWAAWVIDLANGNLPDTPAVAALAGKHWSRAVIGKWASRTTTLESWGTAPTSTWAYEEAWHAGLSAPGAIIDIAGTRWLAVKNQESENSFPAVTAWVESLVRQRLNAVIDTQPAGRVVTCDTDGLIYDDSDRAALETTIESTWRHRSRLWQDAARPLQDAARAAEPFWLVEKAAHAEMAVQGPVHWRTEHGRRLAGIRKDATETQPGTFEFLTWPKLSWQLANGRAGEYVRARRTVRLAGPYTHRWILEDGSTAAPVAFMDDSGHSQLAPFSATSAAAAGLRAADDQHRLLTPLAY